MIDHDQQGMESVWSVISIFGTEASDIPGEEHHASSHSQQIKSENYARMTSYHHCSNTSVQHLSPESRLSSVLSTNVIAASSSTMSTPSLSILVLGRKYLPWWSFLNILNLEVLWSIAKVCLLISFRRLDFLILTQILDHFQWGATLTSTRSSVSFTSLEMSYKVICC